MRRVRRSGFPGRARLHLAAAVVLAAALGTSGCGVPVHDEPRSVELDRSATGAEGPAPGVFTIRIYFVQRERLRPVERSTDDESLATVLASLAEGPTSTEGSAGLVSALAPQPFTARISRSAGRELVTVAVGEAFTSISGDDQLLATAQLVWSATEADPRGRVRLVSAGEVLEVPTDDGLTARPVQRRDFASVAPKQ